MGESREDGAGPVEERDLDGRRPKKAGPGPHTCNAAPDFP